MSNLDQLLIYLRQVEETQLMELLGLTSEDLVDRFQDIILSKRVFLEGEVEIFHTDDDDDNEKELDFE